MMLCYKSAGRLVGFVRRRRPDH